MPEDQLPTLLLVEDDQAVRSVVDRHLRSLGWDVIPVSTGRDAIRLVELGTRSEGAAAGP